MKPKALILFLILPLLLPGCDRYKDSPGPGEPFFCKINGEVFRPETDNSPVGGIGSNPVKLTWNKEDGVLFIRVRNSPHEVSLILVFKDSEIKKSEIALSSDSLTSKAFFTPSNYNPNGPVEDIVSDKGWVSISKVKENKISGSFEFTCKSPKTGKEYRITEGQFNDLSYYYY